MSARDQILHVTECWSTGVARAIMSIVESTPEYDHHLLWEGFETPTNDEQFASIERMPGGHFRRIRALHARTKETEAGVIHLHSSWAGVYGRIWRSKGVRTVYQPHCYAFEDPSLKAWHRYVFKLAESLLAINTDVTAVVSERERQLALGIGRKHRVYLVPNKSGLWKYPRESPTKKVPNRVVMIGEIRDQKDPRQFAAIARASSGTGLQFVWIGDGRADGRDHLLSAKVEVTGWVDGQRLCRELDSALVYLHSAKYEGFPISVLDAVARNCPVLPRNSDAFAGLGLTTYDTIADATAILRAAAEGDLSRLEENSRTIGRHFDPEAIPFAIQAIYGEFA